MMMQYYFKCVSCSIFNSIWFRCLLSLASCNDRRLGITHNENLTMLLLDILRKPSEHILISFFSTPHSLCIFSIEPHCPTMCNSREYLHKAINLKITHHFSFWLKQKSIDPIHPTKNNSGTKDYDTCGWGPVLAFIVYTIWNRKCT